MVRVSLRMPVFAAIVSALLFVAQPLQAAVVATFWSQDYGKYYPHAFFTLTGTPDAGGAAVDLNYGFTAKSISPAILLGTVAGRIDVAEPAYVAESDAHFSVTLTDAQYDALLRLVAEWSEAGDPRYNLNRRNCVHFVAEAARRAGLAVVEPKKLMKKPRSFLVSVQAMNATLVGPPVLPGTPAVPAPAPVPVTPVPVPVPVPAAPLVPVEQIAPPVAVPAL